jgi:hypothetical protein
MVGERHELRIVAGKLAEARQVRQIRLFRATAANEPAIYGHFGDCDIYLTTTLKFDLQTQVGQNAMTLEALSEAALEVHEILDPDGESSSVLSRARWLLVLEAGDHESGQVLRLRKGSAAKYFHKALFFLLDPRRPDGTGIEAAVIRGQQDDVSKILAELKKNDPSVPCHETASTSDGPIPSVALVACAEGGDEEPSIP